jgi:hypothetical protein
MKPEGAFLKKKNWLWIFFEFIFGAFSLKILHGSKFYFVHISVFKFFLKKKSLKNDIKVKKKRS